MQRRPVHPRRARLPPPPPRHPAPHEPPPSDPARVYRPALAYFTPDELAEAFAATPRGRQPTQRRAFMRQDPVQLLPVPAAHLPGGQRTPAGRGRRAPHSRHAALPAELRFRLAAPARSTGSAENSSSTTVIAWRSLAKPTRRRRNGDPGHDRTASRRGL